MSTYICDDNKKHIIINKRLTYKTINQGCCTMHEGCYRCHLECYHLHKMEES